MQSRVQDNESKMHLNRAPHSLMKLVNKSISNLKYKNWKIFNNILTYFVL